MVIIGFHLKNDIPFELEFKIKNTYTAHANSTATAGKSEILHLAGLAFTLKAAQRRCADMTKKKYPKPDYKYWAVAETWSQNQAAFLLHGIDPNKYPEVRLLEKEIPSEFKEVKMTYSLLRSVPWSKRHPEYYFANVGISPIAIIYEATSKNLHIPAQLRKLIAKRYEQETALKKEMEEENYPQEHQASEQAQQNKLQEQPLVNRERNNYLKGIGILVSLLIDEKAKSSRNSGIKYSAAQIVRLMMDKAQNLGVDQEGLKSFDRKITEAMELLNLESNTEIGL